METRLSAIEKHISELDGITILKSFAEKEEGIAGRIKLEMANLQNGLEFDVLIYPQYPLRNREAETIKFINKDLLNYNHVMGNGSICVHTTHSPNLKKKLEYDFSALKAWVDRYYINRNTDEHYEHIILPQKPTLSGKYYSYLFSEIKYKFKKDEFGVVDYSQLSVGNYLDTVIVNNIVQSFKSKDDLPIESINWNSKLKSLPMSIGVFVYIKTPPALYGRLAYSDWSELEPYLSKEFLSFLHLIEKSCSKDKGSIIPVFIGYDISPEEIHWQAIALRVGEFPIQGMPIKFNGLKTGHWETKLQNREINWGLTRNCSYQYFFGRGKMESEITTKKILLIGIGAIGSIVAKTLARSGCLRLDLIDFDIKEPENVCRSEYLFSTGICNKVDELKNSLYTISPFIEVNSVYSFSDAFNYFIKTTCEDKLRAKEIEDFLNSYDYVIDCTADNDLLYVLSKLNIKICLFNLSISNHAKHLVCAVENNRYQFIQDQYGSVLEYNIDDIYNPIGCWNSTFKASYNDINLLVQVALKHLNKTVGEKKSLRNFVVSTIDEFNTNVKISEY